ncbi:DUF3426 domain-containing protein [Stenotrophomonas rhizophila]|uniref:DUF3426 domain-containing protein n=2 Tax=Stenotrophomonas TaxID=40323 RepID=UPI00119ECE5A|nr:DUF3426 domain-containing protein [Stenotrophomonas rhizophila]
MTEPTPPPRRPLATFLRAASEPAPAPAEDAALPEQAAESPAVDGAVDSGHDRDADVEVIAQDIEQTDQDIAPVADAHDADAAFQAPAQGTEPALAPVAPSFMRAPTPTAPTPRWQWGLVAGLVALLALQIAVADRARLAADAGSRPWVAGLCSVLRCSLPAWQDPAAFSMISRDVRPVVGQPGALQVHASFRNDARWAQAWPSLRLSLSDADGRVIGSSVFTPQDYLEVGADAAALLEPGQSAQIAFRVREPAASTVAFTFEFL